MRKTSLFAYSDGMRGLYILSLPLLLVPLALADCVGDTPNGGPDGSADGPTGDSTVTDTGTDTGVVMMDGGKDAGPCVIEAGAFTGLLDPNFNSGVHTGLSPNALAIGSTGSIFVAGVTANCPNNTTLLDFAVMKYGPTGQIANTFGMAGRACAAGGANNGNDFAYAVAVDGVGRVIVAGTFRTANDASQNAGVVRFDAQGTLDSTFGAGGKFTFAGNFRVAYGLKVDSIGKVIVVGSNESPFQPQSSAFVARLSVAGALDVGFNGGNYVTDTNSRGYYGVAIDAQDNIYVAGSTTTNPRDFILKKYNAVGAPDATFGTNGTTTVPLVKGAQGAEGRDLIIGPQGGLWVMGAANLNANEVGVPVGAAYTLTGMADTNIFPNSAFPGRVGAGSVIIHDANYQLRSIASQCDGKAVLAGRYDLPDGGQDMGLVRFLASGQIDMSFGDGGVGRSGLAGNDVPVGVAQDSSGGLVMVGQAGANQHVLARFVP